MKIAESVKNKLEVITKKKNIIDEFRPLPPELLENLFHWFNVELAYTSNALEGNTLSSGETAQVIEKGITIGGKTVREHLEAINHAYAFNYIVELARENKDDITLRDILNIHRLILKGINDLHAGKYRTIPVKIAGSNVILAEAVKIPELMEEFIRWLHTVQEHPVLIAAQAHLKLVSIHPFIDGNGRTARLLMNLLLLQYGYPPAIIKPEDRMAYIRSLEKAQKTGDATDYYLIICEAVIKSLDIYLKSIESIKNYETV